MDLDPATLPSDIDREALPSPEQIARFREQGFTPFRALLSREEALHYRAVALALAGEQAEQARCRDAIFDQQVNVWLRDDDLRRVVLSPRLASIASALTGVPMRLWHDHLLIKRPGPSSRPTEFHQDKPYWPHGSGPESAHPISAWIALGDVPVERGCMSFIPGSQRLTGLQPQNLADAGSLFALRPELAWAERITVPLQAGDCTFHHGCCAHMAAPNRTDQDRVALVVILMDRSTVYSGGRHVVTDACPHLQAGMVIEGAWFPVLPG